MILLFRFKIFASLLVAAALAGAVSPISAQSLTQESVPDPGAGSSLDGAERTLEEMPPDDAQALTPELNEQQYYEAQLRDLCDMGNAEACELLNNLFQGGTGQPQDESYYDD
ncbi:hypothetical protein [Rhodospirillaceae bacterium SYSU D60014]|uniref:hypothetical protein n=1 Tax=Virgifigura deserti TaxID=2268457 RepID=UPI0013C51381